MCLLSICDLSFQIKGIDENFSIINYMPMKTLELFNESLTIISKNSKKSVI